MQQQRMRHISWTNLLTNLAKSQKSSPWAIQGKPMDGLSLVQCNSPKKMLAQPLELKGIRWYLDYFPSGNCLPQRRPSATEQGSMRSECVETKLGLLPFAGHMSKITVRRIINKTRQPPLHSWRSPSISFFLKVSWALLMCHPGYPCQPSMCRQFGVNLKIHWKEGKKCNDSTAVVLSLRCISAITNAGLGWITNWTQHLSLSLPHRHLREFNRSWRRESIITNQQNDHELWGRKYFFPKRKVVPNVLCNILSLCIN